MPLGVKGLAMEFTEHSCKRCGGSLALVGENRWKCPYCGRIYDEEAAVKNTKTMRELFDETKMEIVKNLRRNLYDAVNAEYISSNDVKGACIALKKYLPDDFAANFYEVAVGNNVRALTQHIRKIDVEKNLDEIDSVIRFLIKSLQTEYLLELNNLVEKAYKNRDLSTFEKYATLISTEAEKVQNGIYETKLPREVFIAYSSKDMDKVSELCEVLEAQGLQCFVAARNLRHGKGSVENYDKALKEAMDHCKSFVFVSSMNSRQFSCDALGIEIPYIEGLDRDNSPAEYRNNYISIPHKFKKPRCEYRVEESRGFNAADSITNEFFDGYERVYSPEEVAKRILKQLVEVPTAASATPVTPKKPDTKKICVSCGTENDPKTNFCVKCGGKQFVSTVSEYIKIKNAQDLDASRRREAAAKAAAAAAQPPKKKGKGGLVAGIVIAVGIIGIIVIASLAGGSRIEDPYYDINNGGINVGINGNGDYIIQYPATSEKVEYPEDEKPGSGSLKDYTDTYANITYTITPDGVMTISGSGDMPEFSEYEVPWKIEINFAAPEDSDDYSYNYVWKSPQQDVHTVIIEEGITSVGSYAFSDFDNLTEVSLPASVKRIGQYAFYSNGNLERIDLSNVTDIQNHAFLDCTGLSKVTLCDAIEHVGPDAFLYTNIYDENMKNGTVVIGNCLLKSNPGHGVAFSIPEGVVCIADCACVDNYDIKELVIPESVKYIGSQAFQNCDYITVLDIPSSVVYIGDNAFSSVDSLRSVSVAEGSQLTDIGTEAFRSCNSLKNINLYNATLLTEISEYLFADCDNLVDLRIPSSITKIGSCAFESCDGLAGIMIPTSVTSIGEYAFNGCYYLETMIYCGTQEEWDSISKGSWWNQNTGVNTSGGTSDMLYMNGTYDPDSAEDYTVGLKFSLNSDGTGYFVKTYSGSEGEVVIPSTYLGMPVIEIAERAFEENGTVTSVKIPASIVKIGKNAFYNDDALVSVSFADGIALTEIADSAFYSCGMLTSIKIPKSVLTIGKSVFSSCSALSNVEFEDGSALNELGASAFISCDTLEAIKIPKGVTALNSNVFEQCSLLSSVEFEEGSVLAEIASNAFDECTSLKSINIPDSVTKIGSYAFYYSGLESLAFGENSQLTTIANNAFTSCSSLKRLVLPAALTEIDSWAFNSCNNIEYLSASPSHLQYISQGNVKTLVITGEGEVGSSAFYYNSQLQSITFGDGITAIGSSAFYNCSGLTEVILGSGIESIGESAFYSCDVLESIVIPDNVISLGSSAFASCEVLSSVTIGSGVTSISSGCFEGCLALRSIELPSTLESIGSSAFASSGLESIIIPEGITEIANYTFMHCSNLTTIVIPNSVTSVGADTFYNTKIKNASFPIGIVSNIPKSDFEHIVITGGLTIPNYTFDGCTKLQSVEFPDSPDLIIGERCFRGCTSLMTVTIPSMLEESSIDSTAFENCHALVEVINLTSYELAPGDENLFGGVASNALVVHSGESLLRETEGGFIFISVDGEHHMVGYSGDSAELVFPENYLEEKYQVRDRLFSSNQTLTAVTISGVETIPEGLFFQCSYLKSVKIGEGVKYISDSAFYDCDSLETVEMANEVISIGYRAFEGCGYLKTVTLSSALETIGGSAFQNCSYSLERVVIPSSVTYIGSYAFQNCGQLSGVRFEDSASSWGIYETNYNSDLQLVETITVSSIINNAANLRNDRSGYIWKKVVD